MPVQLLTSEGCRRAASYAPGPARALAGLDGWQVTMLPMSAFLGNAGSDLQSFGALGWRPRGPTVAEGCSARSLAEMHILHIITMLHHQPQAAFRLWRRLTFFSTAEYVAKRSTSAEMPEMLEVWLDVRGMVRGGTAGVARSPPTPGRWLSISSSP